MSGNFISIARCVDTLTITTIVYSIIIYIQDSESLNISISF